LPGFPLVVVVLAAAAWLAAVRGEVVAEEVGVVAVAAVGVEEKERRVTASPAL
jgi:hypothetical protein